MQHRKIKILKKDEVPPDQKIYPEYSFASNSKSDKYNTRVSSHLSSLVVTYRKNKKYLIPFSTQVSEVCDTTPADIRLMTVRHQSKLVDELIDRSTQIVEFFNVDNFDNFDNPDYIEAYRYE